MANEILVLPGSVGHVHLGMVYDIPLAQRIEVPGSPGTWHVVSPTAEIRDEALALMTVDQKTALDNGTALYRERSLPTTLDGAELLAAVRAFYEGWKSSLLAQYVGRYQHAGKTFDAE